MGEQDGTFMHCNHYTPPVHDNIWFWQDAQTLNLLLLQKWDECGFAEDEGDSPLPPLLKALGNAIRNISGIRKITVHCTLVLRFLGLHAVVPQTGVVG
jgi:hypothetical protein